MKGCGWFHLGALVLIAGLCAGCLEAPPASAPAEKEDTPAKASPAPPSAAATAAKEGSVTTKTPAAPPPRRAGPPPAENPRWPKIREGHYVMWVDRVWNTRKPAKIWQSSDVGTLGQHNGTGTYLGEERVNGGTVEFDVKFDAGYLAPEGGGKHFLEIMSWVGDRGDRKAIRAKPSSRIELANLGDRPRCLVWNYGPHFRGRATKIFPIGTAFEPDRWYRIRFDWSYREPAGRVTIHVDDRSYSSAFEFVPGTEGPGRFFLFGHVETQQPDGCLHFRHFLVRPHAVRGGQSCRPRRGTTKQARQARLPAARYLREVQNET